MTADRDPARVAELVERFESQRKLTMEARRDAATHWLHRRTQMNKTDARYIVTIIEQVLDGNPLAG